MKETLQKLFTNNSEIEDMLKVGLAIGLIVGSYIAIFC